MSLRCIRASHEYKVSAGPGAERGSAANLLMLHINWPSIKGREGWGMVAANVFKQLKVAETAGGSGRGGSSSRRTFLPWTWLVGRLMKSNKNATLLIIINQCHPSKMRQVEATQRL